MALSFDPTNNTQKLIDLQNYIIQLDGDINDAQASLDPNFVAGWRAWQRSVQSWLDSEPWSFLSGTADQADAYLAQAADWRARFVAQGGKTSLTANPKTPDSLSQSLSFIETMLVLIAVGYVGSKLITVVREVNG